MRSPSVFSKRGAFTLVELLVVIAIIMALASLTLPVISHATGAARRTQCLSNLRQIALAIQTYALQHRMSYPIAQYMACDSGQSSWVCWDFTTTLGPDATARPGLIWSYCTDGGVQQCPSFRGPSMTAADPYTGYNYNTSYIGRGQGEGPFKGMTTAPASLTQVADPSRTALVGDGGYSSGGNKFMRAPLDQGVAVGTAHAGSQAFRHTGSTNVGFCDGHVATTKAKFRKPGASDNDNAIMGWPENGFLAPDDSIYDRE